MSYWKKSQHVIIIVLFAGMLNGCISAIATPASDTTAATTPTAESSTATPTPEPATAIPATVSGPNPGRWEGSGDASVSFTVTDDGKVQNFEVVVAMGSVPCTVTMDEISVETDGTFTISESATNSGSGQVIEEAVMVTGKFDTATTLTGSLSLQVCGDSVIFSSGGPPAWDLIAEWQG